MTRFLTILGWVIYSSWAVWRLDSFGRGGPGPNGVKLLAGAVMLASIYGLTRLTRRGMTRSVGGSRRPLGPVILIAVALAAAVLLAARLATPPIPLELVSDMAAVVTGVCCLVVASFIGRARSSAS